MNLGTLIASLDREAKRNDALCFMYNLMVDIDQCLTEKLAKIIAEPTTIKDTNRFASLLLTLPSKEYISQLEKIIFSSEPGKSSWLSDYMYALGELLEEYGEDYQPDDEFVHKVGLWLTSTGGGEISWKAGIILSKLSSSATREYILQGAKNTELFHQTRIACIRGVVNHHRSEARILLSELVNDREEYVRKAAHDALEWIKNA